MVHLGWKGKRKKSKLIYLQSSKAFKGRKFYIPECARHARNFSSFKRLLFTQQYFYLKKRTKYTKVQITNTFRSRRLVAVALHSEALRFCQDGARTVFNFVKDLKAEKMASGRHNSRMFKHFPRCQRCFAVRERYSTEPLFFFEFLAHFLARQRTMESYL